MEDALDLMTYGMLLLLAIGLGIAFAVQFYIRRPWLRRAALTACKGIAVLLVVLFTAMGVTRMLTPGRPSDLQPRPHALPPARHPTDLPP